MKNGDTQSRQRQPPGSRESETIRNKRPPGADISFSIPRAPIDETFSVSTPYPIAPPLYSYSTSTSSSSSTPPPPLDVIFLSHIPSCAFIIFKRGWRIFSSSFSSLLRFSVFNFLYPTPGPPPSNILLFSVPRTSSFYAGCKKKGVSSRTWKHVAERRHLEES